MLPVWKRSNTWSSSRRSMPGPSSLTSSSATRSPAPARGAAPGRRSRSWSRRACARARCRAAPARSAPRARGSQIASTSSSGPRSGDLDRRRPCARRRRRTRPPPGPPASRSGTGSSSSSSEPASSRDRSSRSVVSFCSRSTCSRIVARNSARVSSSRSSSWSSSTKPPSEKIGVRSSCEALAMNSLRASSSRASRRCISLKALRQLAQLVLGVDRDRLGEVAGRDLAGRALEALHAAREHARGVVAAGDRDAAARSAPAIRIWRWISADVVLHVVERLREHDHPGRACPGRRSAAPPGRARRPSSACRRGLQLARSGPPRARGRVGGLRAWRRRSLRVGDHVGRRIADVRRGPARPPGCRAASRACRSAR